MTMYMQNQDAGDEARRRLRGALDPTEPTADQTYAAGLVTDYAIEFMESVLQYTPPGRNQAIALTAIEDAKMRAVKAIFDDGPTS